MRDNEGKERPVVLNLSHINNLGSRVRKLVPNGLRFRRQVIQAAAAVCPGVKHLKVRVADQDVPQLDQLLHLETVELFYNVGKLMSPGKGTNEFLFNRGKFLTSIAITCDNISIQLFQAIGESCPYVSHLWFRSRRLLAPPDGKNVPGSIDNHDYFKSLQVLYMRIGENELSVSHFPHYVLPFFLTNARDFQELILAVRSENMNDKLIDLVLDNCHTNNVKKIMIAVPGMNNLSKVLPLSINSVHRIIAQCPVLEKLGNLLSWSLEDRTLSTSSDNLKQFLKELRELNDALEIVHSVLKMH